MAIKRTLPETVFVRIEVDFTKSHLKQERKYIQQIYDKNLPHMEGHLMTEYFSWLIENMKIAKLNTQAHIDRVNDSYQNLFEEALDKNRKNGKKKK